MKVRLHSQMHEWREHEDGVTRFFRAEWDARQWNFLTTTKADPEWYAIEKPTVENLEQLRDVLFRKYQRRRLPWHFIEDLDVEIERRKARGE